MGTENTQAGPVSGTLSGASERKRERRVFASPWDALRYHVSGAVERGEASPIIESPVEPLNLP